MSRRLNDLLNKRFGSLLAIKLLNKSNHNRTRLWLCRCDCGREVERASSKLTNNEIHSCGCQEHTRPWKGKPGEAGFKSLLNSYVQAARVYERGFTLAAIEFKTLVTQPCHYCGVGPNQVRYGNPGASRQLGAFYYNGLDRVNTDKGYSSDNVVPCCFVCNRAKGALLLGEFQEWINRLSKYQRGQIETSVSPIP